MRFGFDRPPSLVAPRRFFPQPSADDPITLPATIGDRNDGGKRTNSGSVHMCSVEAQAGRKSFAKPKKKAKKPSKRITGRVVISSCSRAR